MAHYLRAPAGRKRIIPSGADEPDEIGRMREIGADGKRLPMAERVFVSRAALVMHDDCAREHLGPELHPWSPGRAAFGELAGQPLCWSPIYGGQLALEEGRIADKRDPRVACYWCGGIVP